MSYKAVMITTTKNDRLLSPLEELAAEGDRIVKAYIDQVALDPNSIKIKELQKKLKAIRAIASKF